MLFALALPVLILVIGGAIDFGRMTQLRKEMQDAADVASLGSVAVNSHAYKAMIKGANGADQAKGPKQAKAIFASNMSSHDELSTFAVSATGLFSDFGLVERVLNDAALYRLLPAARQHAIDGPGRDLRRYRQDAGPDADRNLRFGRQLRLRLPRKWRQCR
ncbi:MAG: pilus assembly protein [Asticcacaulis sp.]|nr:pilus assembly protein [Asticcacaulis sp.]